MVVIRTKKLESQKPLWKGPEVDGITQSMLSRFLCCRERFRVLTVEGLRPQRKFNHAIEYGQMWHICEEVFAESGNPIVNNPVADPPWLDALLGYCCELAQRYKMDSDVINKWYSICKLQFPIYVEYWKNHPDVKSRKPICQEETFKIPYKLPSGRIVLLRGKWDSVDWIGSKKTGGVYLQENKTKGDIKEDVLKQQVGSGFDLQTMLYLVAMTESPRFSPKEIKGVRYNVVRRPLAGGKHSIRQHKPTKSNPRGETPDQYYERLQGLIAEEPSWYFMRWKVEITPADLERFKREFLNPILEQLCDWWEWVQSGPTPFGVGVVNTLHWRTPYGFWNVLAEGGSGELDEYINTGSKLGLENVDSLFGELE